MNILCVVAHQLELDPFREKFTEAEQFNTGQGSLYRVTNVDYTVNLMRTGIGLERAGESLHRTLQFLVGEESALPDLVINFGTCGAIHPDRTVGDLVIGTSVLAEDQPQIQLDTTWIKRFREYLQSENNPEIEGIIYSTEKAVADERTRHRIYQETNAQIVEMECYRLAEIASENDIPLLAVKCISDNADEFLMKDFLVNVNEAMSKLSDILSGFIREVQTQSRSR